MQPGYAVWRHGSAVSPDRLWHPHQRAMAQRFALPISFIERHGTRGKLSEDSWGELMMAAQAGNDGAYNRLLSEVAAWLQRYFARRLPPSHVDDVVQEALVTIHLKRHTYEPDRPFRAWIAGIARYKWIDRLRNIERDRLDPIDGVEGLVDDHGSVVASSLDVQRLLAHLKPAQADVIRMVKLEGYSIQEASTATGQSAALVKINIHRGIASLASAIDSDEDID